jgi:nucleoredoxin
MNLRFLLPLIFPMATVITVAETWTNINGQSMEADLVACHSANVSFRKADGTFYSYPLEKLSEPDRIRAQAFSANRTPSSATTATPSSSGTRTTAASPGTLTQDIEDILVTFKGSRFDPVEPGSLNGIRYYAIYYSAHWCPPCRQFTPELVKTYKELKSAHPEFEIVFVSYDKNEEAMKGYMKGDKMPWLAIRFGQGRSNQSLRNYSARAIPNLVFVSADGEVLSASYVDGEYVGPRKVLKDIRSKLK